MAISAQAAWKAFRRRYSFEPSRANFIAAFTQMYGVEPQTAVVEEYVSQMERLKAAASTKAGKGPVIVVRRIISMGHRLPSYKGICNSLHGHNIEVEVAVKTGGVFIDFKEVSDHLGGLLETMDHAMVLYSRDAVAQVLHTHMPWQRLVLLSVEPTTEALAQLIFNEMSQLNYTLERCTVYETAKYSATVTSGSKHVKRVD